MNEVLSNLNQGAQLALVVCGVVVAIIAAIQGTRWGQAKAVQTVETVAHVIEQVARIAVTATEQKFCKVPKPVSEAEAVLMRTEKLETALGMFYQLLPAGMELAPQEADHAIEAAVHAMNLEKGYVVAE